MKRALRYVTAHPNRASPAYWYWQRPGFPLTRLSMDPVDRLAKARGLNEAADHDRGARARVPHVVVREGSVKWMIGKYKASDLFGYGELADAGKNSSRYKYNRILSLIEAQLGDLSFKGAMTRRVVADMIAAMAPGRRGMLKAVLLALFNTAYYYGMVENLDVMKVRVKGAKKRTSIISPDDMRKLLVEARKHIEARAMVTGYALLLFTAQRVTDAITLPQTSRANGAISLRPEKTQKLDVRVHIPEHPMLTKVLDGFVEPDKVNLVTNSRGEPVTYAQFQKWSLEIRRNVGLEHLQNRDFRRTSMVTMAEAGATIPQIAAVSGHTNAEVNDTVEHYLPKTRKLAEGAMLLWGQAEGGIEFLETET